MIPARLGSQRLKQKNLREIDGLSIIAHAIRKCITAGIFDEIWVNSESEIFGNIAKEEGVNFHKRPSELANHIATSEDFVYEFLTQHECDYLFQIHSIAPLLQINTIKNFVNKLINSNNDVLLSCVLEQIECAYQNNPLNFSYYNKTNSQDLKPIQKITWSITGWKKDNYIKAYLEKKCATYAGIVGYFAIDKMEGHVIKTEEDLEFVKIYYILNKTNVK